MRVGDPTNAERVERSSELLEHLDTIATWLALENTWPGRVDLMLLFGGSLPPTWQVAAEAVKAGEVGTLMLVGGRGHTTDALLTAVGLGPDSDVMQRRMDARFRLTWSLGSAVAINKPGPDCREAWPWDRWVSLVIGEVTRLDTTQAATARAVAASSHRSICPTRSRPHTEVSSPPTRSGNG